MSDPPLAVDSDFYESDSCYGDDWQSTGSETTSISSSIYQGLMENGRRYQTLRNKEYCIPSDELQFETYEAGHLVCLILDSDTENPLFQSPIGKDGRQDLRILDIGTGKGTWPIEVADLLPQSSVIGVDLYPPPVDWTPPNCVIEVDDVLQEWLWREPFDLVHMRNMLGSFDEQEWKHEHAAGGWIEQIEVSTSVKSDDGTLPPESALANWGRNITESAIRAGKAADVLPTMASDIEEAGFVDIHEKTYKWPIGPWPRDKRFKDAGMVNMNHWMTGVEGWCMWLFTKFGSPTPWSKEEVYVYCAMVRNEIKNPQLHAYHLARRVWARKPFPGEFSKQPPERVTRSDKAS
ncbi:hypothetical protein N7492_009406 [Penicillium capsulatum]|uniref:TAM domain methyltransferase n=1 Tax=Penicillium capsulatum TaxID=69766 RepID=A0A9W9HTY0_9EURO|nr:hypothetical protein N7492_009406 [Penicillium capsulatum]